MDMDTEHSFLALSLLLVAFLFPFSFSFLFFPSPTLSSFCKFCFLFGLASWDEIHECALHFLTCRAVKVP